MISAARKQNQNRSAVTCKATYSGYSVSILAVARCVCGSGPTCLRRVTPTCRDSAAVLLWHPDGSATSTGFGCAVVDTRRSVLTRQLHTTLKGGIVHRHGLSPERACHVTQDAVSLPLPPEASISGSPVCFPFEPRPSNHLCDIPVGPPPHQLSQITQ